MTSIEWTEKTWNPIVGCTIATKGCTNCYAMRRAYMMSHNPATPQYHGTAKLVNGNPVWTGKMNRAPKALLEPLKRRKPTTYFVNSMGDLFHEDVPDAWIDEVFAVMALCPQHTFQVLTKRSRRMLAYLSDDTRRQAAASHASLLHATGRWSFHHDISLLWPLANVWLGVSVEDQTTADERIPHLLETPAAVRFVSAEPLLGPVGFLVSDYRGHDINALHGIAVDPTDAEGSYLFYRTNKLDWVIVGGESGPGARPMHPDWARSIRDQCAAADVPFLFKQWGDWAPVTIDEDEDGCLTPAYPVEGCGDAGMHKGDQPCLFLEGDSFVQWPDITIFPATGARRIGKKAAGRTLDDVVHDGYPALTDGGIE